MQRKATATSVTETLTASYFIFPVARYRPLVTPAMVSARPAVHHAGIWKNMMRYMAPWFASSGRTVRITNRFRTNRIATIALRM